MFDNVCDNDRQAEYLLAIKDVGWAIIKRKCSKSVFIQSFIPFYYDMNSEMSEKYLTELIHVYNDVVENKCTPDDILLKLGYYTQYINEINEYHGYMTIGAYGTDMVTGLIDQHLLGEISFASIQDYLDNNAMVIS